jgi:pimeloyl-ACP methyl ester carboxylesterase
MASSLKRQAKRLAQHLPTRAPLALGIVAALGAAAGYVQYRKAAVEREHPPAGRFIEVDGVRLHYLDRGQGQPVVLLHGNGTQATEFEVSTVLGMAAAKYRVIAFDRPGYGYSDWPRDRTWTPEAQAELFYKALLQLGVERPVIVAHSWGAMVAVALGQSHPEYPASMLLMSGYYYPTPRPGVPLMSGPAIPVLGDLMAFTISPLIGRLTWPPFIRKLFSPAETPVRFKKGYPVWMSLRPISLRAAATETALMIPAAAALAQHHDRLSMPLIIMSGADDLHVLPRLHAERLHRELPHSRLILSPGVGHMIQHTVPEQVMAAIDEAVKAASASEDETPARAVKFG